MTITIEAVTPPRLDDLGALLCTDASAEKCWCMWHIIAVKAFHAGGSEHNRARLTQLAQSEASPVGLLAYLDGEPQGWCAVGPRERFARAIKTPTYRHKGVEPFANVWLVPCFFIREDARGLGLTRQLLAAAVRLAAESGADALDGFPFADGRRHYKGDVQVGFEAIFADCGFAVIRRPSGNRVVMRRILRPERAEVAPGQR